MEDAITRVDNPYALLALIVMAIAWIIREYLARQTTPKAQASGNGTTKTALTDAKVQLAIVDHCSKCERIIHVESEVHEMRREMKDGFGRLETRIDNALQAFSAK